MVSCYLISRKKHITLKNGRAECGARQYWVLCRIKCSNGKATMWNDISILLKKCSYQILQDFTGYY